MAKSPASSKKFVPTDAQKRETGWQVDYNVNEFSYCCGGREVGNISVYQKHRWYETYSGGWSYTGTDKREWKENTKLSQTPKEAYQKMLKDVRELYPHYPLMINLLPNGEHEALKALLEEDSDARMIHTWRNPNTDNVIEMWVLENNSDVEYHIDGDDDY